MRHVIIGNSAAAIGCVEGIRTVDLDNPITIVADEPHHTYSRPLISYLLGGLIDESRMAYRPADFYESHGVEPMLGVRVAEVDPQQRTLALSGGCALNYDRLLIATGGRPFVPPIPGANLYGVFTFITWEEARQIDRFIEERQARSALVIGAGLIGLKTVEALLARGLKVTVVELADRVLSTIFDPTASRLADLILRREGVDVKTETTVTEIIGRGGRVDHAVLTDGERVDCDLVVVAIGVRPNIGLIPADSGIRVERGIRVDDHLRTTAPDIYAAGDCVEAYDKLIDAYRQIAIWPLAYRQGYIAGINMAGGDRAYDGGFPMNAISVCDVPTISVGFIDPPDDGGHGAGRGLDRYEIMDDYDRVSLTYKKLVLEGHRLVGAMFINDIDRAGIYTGLIRDQVDISQFKDHLLSGSFGLISLPKDYRKHLVVGSGIEV
jgi:NAD(P)H-nitrite reductase large subunit